MPIQPEDSAPENLTTQSEENFNEVNLVKRELKIRGMIFDYALGNAILGLIPIPRLYTLKFLVAAVFIIKMLRDLRAKRGFPKGLDVLAIAGYIFSCIGAFAIALMAWLTMIAIGVFVPYAKGFAMAAALFTLTWALGQAFQSLIGINTQ